MAGRRRVRGRTGERQEGNGCRRTVMKRRRGKDDDEDDKEEEGKDKQEEQMRDRTGAGLDEQL